MNKRIPNGAWCLFKTNPDGIRNNKIVIVQHSDIQDQDTGASYTVKLYISENLRYGDEWQHNKIVLRPDFESPEYSDIIFCEDLAGELNLIGELVAVLF